MNTITKLSGIFLLTSALLLPTIIFARILPGDPSPYFMLDQWSFHATNWYSDYGYAPLAYSNIVNYSNFLWLNTTNTVPAFLFYNVVESDGNTNIICPYGTISLYFNPDWSSTNQGGTGPGEWGNLISLGQGGTNESWWSLYFDPGGMNVYFSSQTNGGYATNYLTAPVSLIGGTWYNLVLTYSATNSAFYTNGVLVTNGPGVAHWPGSDTTFFSIGSDSTGFYQAQGAFSTLQTYNYTLDSGTVAANFGMMSIFYGVSSPQALTNSTPSPPSPTSPLWFTGPGIVQYVGSTGCTNSNTVAMVNERAVYATNGTTSFMFTVAGGLSGEAYDVYGTTALAGKSVTNAEWAWLGQCYSCGVYQITTTNVVTACFMLGSSNLGTADDGLTIAYQALVSKTDPSTTETDGLPNAWIALNGLTGSTNVASLDPDMDGLNNGQEYLYGTKPLVSEGMGVWVSLSTSVSGIP